MVASNHTIRALLQVIRRHVTEEQLRKIVIDLVDVPGNRSFRLTMLKLADEMGIQLNSTKRL